MILNIDWDAHQLEAIDFMWSRFENGVRWAALTMDVGTGKTPVGLEYILRMWLAGRRKFIVVAPNTVTGNWLDDAENFHFPLKIVRFEKQDREWRVRLIRSTWDVLVVSWETLRLFWEELIAVNPQGVVYDEIHKAKNPGSQQNDYARRISMAVKRAGGGRLGLTGTPMTKNPLDVWGIYDVLDPSSDYSKHPLGYGSYSSFELQVCTKKPHPKIKGQYLYEFPPETLDELKKRISKHTYEVGQEVLKLKPPKEHFVEIPLEATQQKAYDELREELVVYLESLQADKQANQLKMDFDFSIDDIASVDQLMERIKAESLGNAAEPDGESELDASGRVSVTLQSVLMVRLQQIAAGHVKTDDGKIVRVPSAKIDWLRSNFPRIVPTEDKALIFTRFREDVPRLCELMDELGYKYVTLTGANSKHARETVRQFREDDGIRVFIGNVAAAGTGLNLQSANHVFFYSHSFNWGDLIQAKARAQRRGQRKQVSFWHLSGAGTIDLYVLSNLGKKEKLSARTVRNLIAILRTNRAA